jgi:peptidoglycan/LPS O-acetylase OafA/YrhL
MMNIYDFIGGALMLGYLVLGLFFLKFWRRTRDPLFMMFAFAFWLLAANAIAVSATEGVDLDVGWTYVLRLLAFVLIIVAIIRKNTETKTPS